jgi:phosphorylcholine metabolism protein LicD
MDITCYMNQMEDVSSRLLELLINYKSERYNVSSIENFEIFFRLFKNTLKADVLYLKCEERNL